MARDLGIGGDQVHENARMVLDYWFALPTEKHFAVDPAIDREIATRFDRLRDDVFASDAADWRGDPDALLAAIILLDQFSRNIHRDTARAFEADDLSASLTLLAIDRGWDLRYPPERRAFSYMPLMHAEDASLQALSIEKFTELGVTSNLKFAEEHSAVIDRFGRFPSRNAALGRDSSPEERAFLADNGPGW